MCSVPLDALKNRGGLWLGELQTPSGCILCQDSEVFVYKRSDGDLEEVFCSAAEELT